MPDAVTRITLEVNSVTYEFFSAFTEDARTISRQVNYMNTTGKARMLARHTFSLDKIRSFGDTLDFDTIFDGTVTVEYETGERITFGQVHTMEVGAETADGESDMTSTIAFGAQTRIVN
jgi:hypothetical protein